MEEEYEFLIEPSRRFSVNWRELWQYRELFYFFAWRDIKVKYKQAVLGVVWVVLQPLAMAFLFTLVFSRGLKVDTGGVPYPIFAYSGLLVWGVFSGGLLGAANSMVSNANIIKKIYFPRLIIPASAILTSVFDYLVGLIVYFGLLVYYYPHVAIVELILFLVLSLVLTVITTFGLGTLIAALNVKYRDVQYTLPFLIQFLLFVNPVVYPITVFPSEGAQYLMALNPMTSAIQLSRGAFSGGGVRWELVGISFVSSVLLFVVGIYVFRKTEGYFADLI